jgi:hypothetical protein
MRSAARLPPSVGLKGRCALSIVGMFVLFGIPAILAATRLARPDSWWATRFYDEIKMIQTGHRCPVITA